MSPHVAIVDYGIGNLFSVQRSFEEAGAQVLVTSDKDEILDAPRLVLPGVGAFANGMKGLRDKGLDKVIISFIETGRPFLGICLGMQMLASRSEEFGTHEGLGVIPGVVKAIPSCSPEGDRHKIPHIGWTSIFNPGHKGRWKGTILQDTTESDAVYLVHSFAMYPEEDSHRLADCDYNGVSISAAVSVDNVYGTQFHPEKSGEVGLTMIRTFLSI